MSRTEEAMLRRWSQAQIVVGTTALGIAAVPPRSLCIALGLKRGNPVALGLLAARGVPRSTHGGAVGVAKLLVEHVAHGAR